MGNPKPLSPTATTGQGKVTSWIQLSLAVCIILSCFCTTGGAATATLLEFSASSRVGPRKSLPLRFPAMVARRPVPIKVVNDDASSQGPLRSLTGLWKKFGRLPYRNWMNSKLTGFGHYRNVAPASTSSKKSKKALSSLARFGQFWRTSSTTSTSSSASAEGPRGGRPDVSVSPNFLRRGGPSTRPHRMRLRWGKRHFGANPHM